jgi:membrane-anchored mycosin MYCP
MSERSVSTVRPVSPPTKEGLMIARTPGAFAVAALTGASVLAGGPASAAGRQCAAPATTIVRATPWAQQALAPQRAWALTRGEGVVVGVVDTGVSAASPALSGLVLPGRDVNTKRRADDDCSGHGTFVAGLLAARPRAGSGFAGIAPGARVLPVRVNTDESQVDPASLSAGIRAAVDDGAQVITVAEGTSSAPAALRAAVAYAATHDVLVVASADQPDSSRGGPVYPAALPGVMAVGSIQSSGKPVALTPASSPPALASPGSDLVSVAPVGAGNVTASGSGVAVAFVAGAAALVRAYRPKLTAPQVRHRLETTADHPSGRLPDPFLGYGMVDPVAALTTELPEESGEVAPQPHAEPVEVVLPTPRNRRPEHIALITSAAVTGLAALGGLAAATARRGRRRGWRPASDDPPRSGK